VGIFRLIGAYIAFAWRWATRSWLRFPVAGSGRHPLFFFLFLLFVPIALILVLFGVDLDDFDRWLDAHGGQFDAVGSWLFRIVCGLVILLCAFMVLGAIFDRKNPDKPGFGCAFLALVVGYFAWFGMTG
jgi:hypothetical protein